MAEINFVWSLEQELLSTILHKVYRREITPLEVISLLHEEDENDKYYRVFEDGSKEEVSSDEVFQEMMKNT
jgi:hypothetical protein